MIVIGSSASPPALAGCRASIGARKNGTKSTSSRRSTSSGRRRPFQEKDADQNLPTTSARSLSSPRRSSSTPGDRLRAWKAGLAYSADPERRERCPAVWFRSPTRSAPTISGTAILYDQSGRDLYTIAFAVSDDTTDLQAGPPARRRCGDMPALIERARSPPFYELVASPGRRSTACRSRSEEGRSSASSPGRLAGSGKSTFLNILGGLDSPTGGESVFAGASLLAAAASDELAALSARPAGLFPRST